MKVPVEAFKSLKYGKDFTDADGKVYSAKELTYGAPIHSYAYITDTLYLESVAKQLKGTDMIYHEATFLHDKLENALKNYHSTSLQAAQFAKEAGASKLLIGHFSARYDDLEPLLTEAQGIFGETMLAKEGETYEI